MKTFKQHILEKLKIGPIESKLRPKTKEELIDLIIKEIKTNGSKCSLNHIDVSNIDDMSDLFNGMSMKNESHPGYQVLSKFNGNISEWDVSNVTNMRNMFVFSKYNGDISRWDVSNVENMEGMFFDSSFNGDISDWDVSNVTDMVYMFQSSKFNGDISKWDVSNVEQFNYMFKKTLFNGDLSKWKINPKAKGNMNEMFTGSPLENTPPDWYYT